jgi:ABC-type nitrate/sulfonate/bicarbonate transport system permease component
MENQQPMRIKDAKTSIVYQALGGTVLTSTGLGLCIHSYWHLFDSQMLIVGLVLIVFGVFLVYKSTQKAIEKYHEMTRAFFQVG